MKEGHVMMFLGEAVAQVDNPWHYPIGQKHAAILFLRQKEDSAPDWSKAAAELESRGWSAIKLGKPVQ